MSEPGWLPDPSGRFEYRYFDGMQWTDQVSTGGAVGADAPVPPPVPPPAPGGVSAPSPSGVAQGGVMPPVIPPVGAAHRRKLVPWLVAVGVGVVVVVAVVLALVLFTGGGSGGGQAVPGTFEGSGEGGFKITMKVEEDLTVNEVKYVMECGGVSDDGTATFGTPYKLDGRFTFPAASRGSITGQFKGDGSKVTGSWEYRSCSGNWDGQRVHD